LAIFRELDGEAVIRTAMKSVPKSLDDNSRSQLEVANAHQRFRVDEGRIGGFRGVQGEGHGLDVTSNVINNA
jgi:hypothetical protein